MDARSHRSEISPRSRNVLHLPSDASILTRLRVAYRALRVLEQAQDDPVAAALVSASLDSDVFRRHATTLAQSAEGRALLEERPALHRGSVDLDELRKLAKGTVGHAYAQYYAVNGLLPFESGYEVRDDADYLIKWYRETHDLHHIVTAYDTDPIGEMELQAFAAGNLGFRHALFIVALAGLLPPVRVAPIWTYWNRLKAAYRRGKRSRNLFAVRYDRYFERTVETLRADLQIPPPTASRS